MARLAHVPPVEREVPVARRGVPAPGPVTHAVLRVGTGLLFLQHGLQKLGFLGTPAVPLASQMGVAGILELAGGLLLVLGLFTRPVAVVLAAEMAVAYALAHAPRGLLPIANGGEVALLFGLIFVFLAGNGPGAAALDRYRR